MASFDNCAKRLIIQLIIMFDSCFYSIFERNNSIYTSIPEYYFVVSMLFYSHFGNQKMNY